MIIKNISHKNLLTFSFLFFFSFVNINYNFLNISGTTNFYNIPATNGEIETTDGIIYGLSTGDFMLGRYQRDGYQSWKNPHEYKVFFENRTEGKEFYKYVTSYGLQAKIFGNLVKNFNFKLNELHLINSLIFSFIIASFVILLQKNFSFLPSLIFALAISTSPWVIAHGKDIRWITWSWYLPIWWIMIFNYYCDLSKIKIFLPCISMVFASILFRCLFGYEYISTILSITLFFFSYIIIKKKISLNRKISFISVIALILFLSFIVSFLFQNEINTKKKVENFSAIKQRIYLNLGFIDQESLKKNPCLVKSFRSEKEKIEECKKSLISELNYQGVNRIEVVSRYFVFRNLLPWIGNLENYINYDFKNYLRDIFWNSNYINLLKINKYLNLKNLLPILSVIFQSALFLFVVIYSFFKVYRNGDVADKVLLTGAFFSSISWFFLASKYAFVHIHLCFISWYLSFIPFAYALIFQKLSK